VGIESAALLGLLADIRAAVGDPTGKLMQDELVEHCRKLYADNELLRAANSDTKRIAMERNRMESALKKIATAESSGDWGQDLGCIRAIARMGLDRPNAKDLARRALDSE
jgi:hypothetical protein